jgi:hypothetical protein
MEGERMSDAKREQLSERQELLLSAYADGECSVFSRLLAKRLLASSEGARLFLSRLQSTSQVFKSFAVAHEPADLCGRISARIEAEHQAEETLAKRGVVDELHTQSWNERVFSRHSIFGGLSGAAVAAMVLVLVTRPSKPGEILPVYTGGPVAAQHSSPFHQATLGGGAATRSLAPQSSVQVDWMRTKGPLQVIEDPRDRSAVIWVRRQPGLSARKAAPFMATPTIRVLANEDASEQPVRHAK